MNAGVCRSVYPGVGWQSQSDGGQSGGTLDSEVGQSAISQEQLLGLEGSTIITIEKGYSEYIQTSIQSNRH